MREALLAKVGGVACFYAQLRQLVRRGCAKRETWGKRRLLTTKRGERHREAETLSLSVVLLAGGCERKGASGAPPTNVPAGDWDPWFAARAGCSKASPGPKAERGQLSYSEMQY